MTEATTIKPSMNWFFGGVFLRLDLEWFQKMPKIRILTPATFKKEFNLKQMKNQNKNVKVVAGTSTFLLQFREKIK